MGFLELGRKYEFSHEKGGFKNRKEMQRMRGREWQSQGEREREREEKCTMEFK